MKNRMKSSFDDQIFNLMDALRAPILTFSTSWADCIPQRLKNVITMARMESLIKHEDIATDPECLAYIMTATLEFPLSREQVDIYTHLGCKVSQKYWDEDHWNELQAPKELSKYDIDQYLNPLKRFIYDKRRKHLKEEMKFVLKKELTAKEMNEPMIPVIVESKQLTLF